MKRIEKDGITLYPPPPTSFKLDRVLYESVQKYAQRTNSKFLSEEALVQFSSNMALRTTRMEEQGVIVCKVGK
jgi:hypothetical protein